MRRAIAAAAAVAACVALPASPARAEGEPSWGVRASVSPYFFPDGSAFLLPIVAVDHGWLHLEGRYNYEQLRTGSLWIGWNLDWGDELSFSLTPMVGGVFGDKNGVAVGAEWTLAWGPLELYSELEFVFDCGDFARSNVYTWTELSAWPWEWLRAGIAVQRTNAVESTREVQWGPLVGARWRSLSLTGYWFNPGQADDQYWVAALGLEL
jgi:hypothetical protein